jgi:hypothetical protein
VEGKETQQKLKQTRGTTRKQDTWHQKGTRGNINGHVTPTEKRTRDSSNKTHSRSDVVEVSMGAARRANHLPQAVGIEPATYDRALVEQVQPA